MAGICSTLITTKRQPNQTSIYLPNTVCSTISICLTCLHCKNLRNCSPEINSYICMLKGIPSDFLCQTNVCPTEFKKMPNISS